MSELPRFAPANNENVDMYRRRIQAIQIKHDDKFGRAQAFAKAGSELLAQAMELRFYDPSAGAAQVDALGQSFYNLATALQVFDDNNLKGAPTNIHTLFRKALTPGWAAVRASANLEDKAPQQRVVDEVAGGDLKMRNFLQSLVTLREAANGRADVTKPGGRR